MSDTAVNTPHDSMNNSMANMQHTVALGCAGAHR